MLLQEPVGKVIDPREHFLHVAKVLILHLHAIGSPESEYAKAMGEMLQLSSRDHEISRTSVIGL